MTTHPALVNIQDCLQLASQVPSDSSLQHGHQELEAAGPVADEEHHADQVKDPHEDAQGADELKQLTLIKGFDNASLSVCLSGVQREIVYICASAVSSA